MESDEVPPERAADLVPREALAWLLHPVTLAALALLLLNDHLLKAAWPGLVTGKLSDFAGLALVPPAVTAAFALLLPRLSIRIVAVTSTLIVAMGFSLAKATALGAAWASAGWSWASGPSTIRCDPTDLLALPALAASWWAFRHVRRHPLPERTASFAHTAIVLPVAGLAILATSAADYPRAGEVMVHGGAAIVAESRYSSMGQAFATTDGESWSDLNPIEAGQLPRVETSTPTQSACVPADPDRCYRTVPDRMAIEQTDDGGVTWVGAWSISPDRQRFLSRAYPGHRLDGSDVAAESLGVLPVGAGHIVVVAAGRDGVVLRHPDGRWQRIGFPTPGSRDVGHGAPSTPPALTDPGQRIAGEYVYLALGVSIGLLLGGLAAASAWRRAWWVIPLASALFDFFVVAVFGIGLGISSVLAVQVLIGIGLLLWIAVVHSAGALTLARSAILTALVVVALVLGSRPFVAWSSGEIDSYDAAVRSATQLVGGSIIAIILVGLTFQVRDRRRRS
jgi:hypothetical protein